MAIITISRGTFSGGQDLAKSVAEELGYRCISREVITEAANHYGANEEKLYRALMDKPGFLERSSIERNRYIALIQAELCREVKDDNVVYHGHAGHLLLRGVPHLIRVRVIANMDVRIGAAMRRHDFNTRQAFDYIHKVDDERAKWTKFLYHIDWKDPLLYDFVINLDQFNISDACQVVCAFTKLSAFKTTKESQRVMDNLTASTHIKASIYSDSSIATAQVEVEADNGIIALSGTVGTPEELNRINEIVRNIPNIREIKSTISLQTDWALSHGRYMQ